MAVDRCMAPNPAQRPDSIAALRNILGIVAIDTPAPVGTTASAAHVDAPVQAPVQAPSDVPIDAAIDHVADSSAQPDEAAAPEPVIETLAAEPAQATEPPPSPHPAAAEDPVPVPLQASAAAPAEPALAQAMPEPAHAVPLAKPINRLRRWQRWALAGGVVAVLAAAGVLALTMFAAPGDGGSFDRAALGLPQTPDRGLAGTPTPAAAPPTDLPASPAAPVDASKAAGATDASGTEQSGAGPAINGTTTATASTNANAQQAPAPAQAAQPDANPAAAPAAATTTAPAPVPERPRQPEPAVTTASTGKTPDASASGIDYRLRIQPWGVVYVDGVDRGVSPPVKHLTLAPGKHTLRITNPAFADRVFRVDAGHGNGQIGVDFNQPPRSTP